MKWVIRILTVVLSTLLVWSCQVEDLDLDLNPDSRDNIKRIPVVVHVIHNGEPIGTGANISYE